MIAIAEVSGADSIAAILRFAEERPGCAFVPTYVRTGTEFGDLDQIHQSVEFLRRELPGRGGELASDLIEVFEPTLWRALCGRYARALTERYGAYLPCVPCHLYLHLMRIPIAREFDARIVVSGERELHDGRTKANQMAAALDAYATVLGSVGIELSLPIRSFARTADVLAVLGPRWLGGSPQLECVLSGNETGVDGSSLESLPERFVDTYVLPAGLEIARLLTSGRNDWDAAVERVLRRAPEPSLEA